MKRRRSRYNIGLARRINRRAWALLMKRPVGAPQRTITGVNRLPRGEAVLLAIIFGGGYGSSGPAGKLPRLGLRLWHLHMERSSTRTLQPRRLPYQGRPPRGALELPVSVAIGAPKPWPALILSAAID